MQSPATLWIPTDQDLEFVVGVLREAEELAHADRQAGPSALRHVLSAFNWLLRRASPTKPDEDGIYQFLLRLSSRAEFSWWEKLDGELRVSCIQIPQCAFTL
jgi:hypothetical protein